MMAVAATIAQTQSRIMSNHRYLKQPHRRHRLSMRMFRLLLLLFRQLMEQPLACCITTPHHPHRPFAATITHNLASTCFETPSSCPVTVTVGVGDTSGSVGPDGPPIS